MADMCAEALRKGLVEIAFTEHFDPLETALCYNKYDPDAFFKGIQAARAEFGPRGLTIKAGVEVGEMHLRRAAADAILNQYPYDLVLGSLHACRGENIFNRPFFEKRDIQAAARDYFEEMVEMIEGGGFNVLSHLDVIKRMGYRVYGKFDLRDLEAYIRPVFAACIKMGIAPEINTSGLRLAVGQPHPTLEAIQWYREMGGERLTIGSDAHNPQALAAGLDQAISMAKSAGFTTLTQFTQREVAQMMPI
jgi:histidinol-phosphatase (PHP family)